MMMKHLAKIEKKYQEMENNVNILSKKVKKNDVISIMTNNFRTLLNKKKINFSDANIFSEVFGFSMIMFEEAMEEERKERFFDFVSSTFSKENLRGKEERLLYDKMLRRIERKMKKEEKFKAK